jgi:uncharacterized membrane protein
LRACHQVSKANPSKRAEPMIAVPHATSFAGSTPGGVDASIGVDGRSTELGTGLRWSLTRNCSLSPRATARAYALLCGVSLVIAFGFFALGYRIVLVFCGLELLAVGAALLVWGRHVGEGEVVTLHADTLRIERRRGATRARVELPLAWTRVIEEDAQVLLACGARRVEVGTQVGWPRRRRFAQELRRALAAPLHDPTRTFDKESCRR